MHDIDSVLSIWCDHFASLCSPKSDPNYDDDHYKTVNDSVLSWLNLQDRDNFLNSDFTLHEITSAIAKLNLNKAPGSDLICAEHLKYGGERLVCVLQAVFRWVIEYEYVPLALREGIQVPLHKGKNSPTLCLL